MKKVFVTFIVCLVSVSFYCQATANKPYPVGELGELWQFPSDHLPVGMTLGSFHIALWNVLNKDYLGYIEQNTQGLKESLILRENVPINGEVSPPFPVQRGLTFREALIGERILEMVNHPTHPRSLIALQEAHQDLVYGLKTSLPSSWVVVTPPNQSKSEDVFLYNSELFEVIGTKATPYPAKLSSTIFTLDLREKTSNQRYRFIQSHIPGGPASKESVAKFAEEALKQYQKDLTIVLMGDMNQSPSVIAQALTKVAENLTISQPYRHLPVPYPTHINTKCQAAWIDNFFVVAPKNQGSVKASNPEELFDSLKPIVDLLKNMQPQ